MADIDKIRVNGVDYGIQGSDIYSTTEQAIGTWIDGKPIYRKVIVDTTNNTDYSITHGISNIDQITCVYGICDDDTNFIPFGFSANTDYAFASATKTNILIRVASEYADYTKNIIIEYTKTTD